MNYLKIYESLCDRGKLCRNITYTEYHHIIPKCLSGTDDKINLTKLSGREHFIAHLLLTKIYPNNEGIQYAFCMMIAKNRYQNRYINSKYYERIKKIHSERMKSDNPMKNPETAAKVSQIRKEKYASGELIPRKLSDKERLDISSRMLGDKNPTKRFPEKHNFKNNSYVQGKLCYNDGIKNKYFYPDESIPEGFVRGCKPYKRTRNGVESNHG